MTINKSQGQSVKYIGINFQTPVFTHGQFHIAMSRCTSGNHVKVLFRDNSTNTITKNMVCPKAILNIYITQHYLLDYNYLYTL